MLRIARIATLVYCAALGASCAGEELAVEPASAGAPSVVASDDPSADPCVSSPDAAVRAAVDELRFRTELLKEDIRLEPERETEYRFLVSAPVRTPIHEKLATLRADADRLAAAITDPQMVRDVKDVLEVLDECAKSPYAAPVVARSIDEQRDIVGKLRFDLERLRLKVKQREVFLAEHRYYVGPDHNRLAEESFARMRADAARLAPAVTDFHLAQELKTDVLEPLDAIAKSSFAKR